LKEDEMRIAVHDEPLRSRKRKPKKRWDKIR
jgi:hypothetical protein